MPADHVIEGFLAAARWDLGVLTNAIRRGEYGMALCYAKYVRDALAAAEAALNSAQLDEKRKQALNEKLAAARADASPHLAKAPREGATDAEARAAARAAWLPSVGVVEHRGGTDAPATALPPKIPKIELGYGSATDGSEAQHAAGAKMESGSPGMWQHVIGERSTAVGKMARVRAPKGLRLRTRAAAESPDVGIMPFNELLRVERRTEHGWCWVVSMGEHAGKTGFCEEQFLSLDPPEPTAHLYRVQAGDNLGAIAERYY
jgi:hypothetical protein